ncbi:S41 family peptidase, partial [bacterium]|nr:S41 family peptidase [bacterium]
AIQLTYHEAHDHKAVWSNNGQTLAFASDRYGNYDVYTMSANGGPANRITFHSNSEIPYTFTNDNKNVIFGGIRQDDVKHRQYPHRSQSELYTVPSEGGRVNQVFTFPAEYVQLSKDGNTMLYHDKVGGEDEFRKHHQSSVTRDIWMYNKTTDTHTKLTSFKGEDRHAYFSNDETEIYYLSEEGGSFNVHKMSVANPSQNQKLTNFSLHPVRFLSVANGIISFGYDGELYTMREGQEPQKLTVNLTTQNTTNSDKFISINGGVKEMAVSPNGKEIAFITRGEVFVTSVDKSFTKRITNTPEQERFVTWGPEGKSIVYSCERGGKWQTYKTEKTRKEEPFFYASTLLKDSVAISSDNDIYLADYSPDGKLVAYIEGRRSLKVMNLETKAVKELLTPKDLFHMSDGDKYFTWSPDSKWLLVDWGLSLNNSEVLLLAADGSKRVNLNESGYYDYAPKWVNEGKQMIWFSNRDGLKSYATSGRSEADVYSMFFTQEAWDDYNLDEDDYKLKKEIEEATEEAAEENDAAPSKDKKDKKDKKNKKDKKEDDDKDAKKKEIKPLTFDWGDMKDRTSRLTIHSSRLGDAVLSKDGSKLYYLSRFEGTLNLWTTDLRTKKTEMAIKLDANSGSLEWDKDMKNLYLLSSGKISKIDVEGKKKKSVKIKGEMKYDANAERLSMFDHVWIRTNAIFYHPDFHGIDWNQMKTEYSKYVPHASNSYELSEILSEMLGELNVSHAGARAKNYSVDNADATASLGIFARYNYTGNGLMIDEVIKGGPLDKAKFNVKAGMVIEKIDGVTIEANQDVAKYLNRKAGKFTLLEIRDPKADTLQIVTMKPISLGSENRLLYKRWVKINEKEVKEKSNGKLGYVHIPGMGDGPYRSIYQDMMGKYFEKEGMIIDTRFNGGGDLVADLAMFFTGVPFITYATEAKVVGGEPTSRWTKPTLALINEAQYSDGHCFACGYKDLKIGKMVGMPTPGTCSFAGWERLPDGSVWGVVPVSAKDINGKWMENSQTEPDILVKNMPGSIDKGIDQQLEKAIEVMLNDLK